MRRDVSEPLNYIVTMERGLVQDIVIVGAGIAGLTTSLGLHRYLFHFLHYQLCFYLFIFLSCFTYAHRLGVPSLVLESSDTLRVTGFALSIWENAWKALDAVGVGDILRDQHLQLKGYVHPHLLNFLFLLFFIFL